LDTAEGTWKNDGVAIKGDTTIIESGFVLSFEVCVNHLAEFAVVQNKEVLETATSPDGTTTNGIQSDEYNNGAVGKKNFKILILIFRWISSKCLY